MRVRGCIAPKLEQLQPYRTEARSQDRRFPVYENLVTKLINEQQDGGPDADVAHTMATCAAYSYSDAETLSMIMARMGLEDNQCVEISQSVDAMGIDSNAFLVQSADGSVVILSYRGTEPADVIDWLAITDVSSDRVQMRLDTGEPVNVHAGFYRNVRATRYKILQALRYAGSDNRGESILDITDSHSTAEGTSEPTDDSTGLPPLKALYITGHSLGGAMAVLMTTMILQDKEFGQLAEKIKAVYTFGQPMIGSPDFAKRAADMKGLPSLFRYVYRGDLVPQLPPKESGDFEHFGTEFRYAPTENPPWKVNSEPTTQTDLAGIGGALVGFFSEKIKNLAGFLFPTSIVDHYPQRYITWLTPPDGPTEFGDTSVGVVPKAKAKEKVVNPREAIAALLSIVKKAADKEIDMVIDKVIQKVEQIPSQIAGRSLKVAEKVFALPLAAFGGALRGAGEADGDVARIPLEALYGMAKASDEGVNQIVKTLEEVPIVGNFLSIFGFRSR